MMALSTIKDKALSDIELLDQVVKHKQTFYPSAWPRYDLARVGTLKLLPAETRLEALRQDYRQMGIMIFGDPLPFDSITAALAELEKEING
jgi:hypothetical protein